MITSIKQWFMPPAFEGDEEKMRLASLIHAMTTVMLLFIITLIAIKLFNGKGLEPVTALDFIGCLSLLPIYHWLQRGKVTLAGIWFISLTFVIVTLVNLGYGTIQTVTTPFYILAVFLAGMLFNRRGILGAIIVSSLLVLGVMLASNAGILPPPDYTVRFGHWIAYTGLFGISGGMSFFALESTRKTLAQVKKEVIERKRIEMELRVSEARFRALFEQSHDGVLIFGLDGLTRESNQRAADMLGYTQEEISQYKNRDFFVDSQSENTFARVQAGEYIPLLERVLRKKDGSFFPVEINIELVCDKDGAPLHGQCIMRDITERKRTEEQLRQFSRMVEASPTSILIVGMGGDIQYVNPKFTQLTGYALEEILGQKTRILGTEFTPLETLTQMQEAFMAGNEWSGELCNRKKNGDIYWERASMAPIKNEKGEITHYMGMSEDMTHIKEVETSLRASESRYRAIVEDQTEFICRFLPDMTVTFVNQAYCQYLGKQPDEIIGKSYLNLVSIEHHETLIHNLENLKFPPFKAEIERDAVFPDGEIRWQHWGKHAILNPQGEVVEFQYVGRDITELKKLQHKQQEMTLLEERQRLARDLHDAVSQTLFSARLTSEMLLQKRGAIATSELWSNIQHFTRLITSALGEMRVLLLELRPENLERANLSSILGHLVDAAKVRTTANIEIKVTEKEKIPPEVKVAFYRITQEALNNAIKHAGCANISILFTSELDYAQLIIEDDGRGTESIEHNEGAKMGLNIMEERAHEINGILKMISRPDDGTKISCIWRKKSGGKDAAEKN